MKISHLSKNPQVLEALCDFQPAGQCEVSSILYNQSVDLTNRAISETDIVHIHGISLLNEPAIKQLVENRLSNKKAVVLSLFAEAGKSDSEADYKNNRAAMQESSVLFLQDTSFLEIAASLENWSWSSSPVLLAKNHVEEDFEAKEKLKVLYFNYSDNDPFLEKLQETVEQLKVENLNLELIVSEYSKEAIDTCDILIENPNLPAISYRSLAALAAGKTVLANIPENSQDLTRQFEYAPILKTTADNILYRLKSLVKQPKSLRDFGRRGRKYIEDYHNPKDICQAYIDIYRQFV